MRERVREAFLAMRAGNSPDVIVADPHLNEAFLQECRSRGLDQPPALLNQCLLNLRKTGALRGLSSRRASVRNQEDFRFASEVAIRFLERRDQQSLDQILCDPGMAAEFDRIAAEIASGFSPFQYRWAALNLRKRRKLQPELLGKVVPPEAVVTCKARDLRPDQIPVRAGLYLFIQPGRVLYVGECQNLRKRISKHLDHSDNKGLAHWLWERGVTDLQIEYHVLAAGVPTRVRKALEAELIRSRDPLFNVAGAGRPS
jgi:hypothetical protein